MRGRPPAVTIEVSAAARQVLEGWLRATTPPMGLARRARVILLLADGETYIGTAGRVGLGERHVRKWVLRFLAHGPEGLHDRPRPGRSPVFPPRGRDACGESRLRAAR